MKGLSKTIRRRRQEGRTDYNARLYLLQSDKPRLIIRKTNRYIVAQIVKSDVAQDKVLFTVTSKELLAHGWPEKLNGSLKSLVAAYLTGMLLANKAKNINEAIIDIGLQRNVKKGRLYALVRGASDAGLNIPYGKEVAPDDDRLESNEKTREILTKLKAKLNNGRKGNKE